MPTLIKKMWLDKCLGGVATEGAYESHQGSPLIRNTPLFAYPRIAHSKWLGMSLGGPNSHWGASGAFQRRPIKSA